jgi:hypothetical protein
MLKLQQMLCQSYISILMLLEANIKITLKLIHYANFERNNEYI